MPPTPANRTPLLMATATLGVVLSAAWTGAASSGPDSPQANAILASCSGGFAVAGAVNSYCKTEFTSPGSVARYQVIMTGPFTGAVSVHVNDVVGTNLHFVATCSAALVTGQQVMQNNCYNWPNLHGSVQPGMRIRLEGVAELHQPLSQGCVGSLSNWCHPFHAPTVGQWEVRLVS